MNCKQKEQTAIGQTGVATEEELKRVRCPDDRLTRGPVVVVECFQEIPCDPCIQACPRGAITIEGNLNNIPTVDFDLCNGCGVCISKCPGLAIFVIDSNYSDAEALVMLPYEFIPLPEVGEAVDALDREGCPVAEARVVKVLSSKAFDRTSVISLAVPKGKEMDVRSFRRR